MSRPGGLARAAGYRDSTLAIEEILHLTLLHFAAPAHSSARLGPMSSDQDSAVLKPTTGTGFCCPFRSSAMTVSRSAFWASASAQICKGIQHH